MASKVINLNKRCFYVQSGVSNHLGKTLAVEVCRRLKSGSVAMLIDVSEDDLQVAKKEIQFLENNVEVIGCSLGDWQHANATSFHELLATVLAKYDQQYFELSLILHNEGRGATDKLMEPQYAELWQRYIQENLYAVVALNQEFLQSPKLADVAKLVVNVSSSVQVLPFVYNSLMCSCKKARDMYFRAMAAEEGRRGVDVVNYSPGLLKTHEALYDENNNVVELADLIQNEKLLKLPRVKPIESTLKLINILQELSFISGHDVDYYDTFVL